MGMPASGDEVFFTKVGTTERGPVPGVVPKKDCSSMLGGLIFLLRLCKFVIRLRSAAGVPAFKGLPRWDPVSDWPSFEAKSVLWLRGLVWNLPSSASLKYISPISLCGMAPY